MGLKDNAEKMTEICRGVVTPALSAGEELRGVIYATHSKTFSAKIYAIGITPQRLVMVEVDRKYEPKAAPISVRPEDIKKSSVDGYGGGLSHFLASDPGEIRIDTNDESYKLAVLGGGMDQLVTGQGQLQGKTALLQFLADARGIS